MKLLETNNLSPRVSQPSRPPTPQAPARSRRISPDLWLLLLGSGAFLAVLLSQLDWQNFLPNLVGLWHEGKALLRADGTTLQALLLPTLVWIAITFFLKEISPKPNFWSRLIVGLGLTLLALRYILWRFFNSLNLDDPLNGTISILLFIAELLTLTNTICFFALCIFSKDRSPEADRLSQAVIRGEYLPWVDVILPTYNEGVDILRRSVIACQAMDYPHKRIYLLDDTRRPAVRALAAELGCEYRDRPDNRHAKAGNINHALPTLTGELIAVFDADFVPSRNFLTRTVGFFQDAKTAMVQTPQHFFNEDPVTVNLGLEGILNNEQTLFFRFIQPSRDFFNAVVCCGTCFVIRRSALDEIGGIPTDSITEDYLTSLYLQGRGYQIKYLNEALSAGMSPETISAYINQRLRWGQGTLQILFLKDNFFTIPNLNFLQRFYHSLGVLYWLLSIPRVIFLLAPLAFLLFGLAPLRATINEVVYFYCPYYLGNIMAFSWLTEGRRSAFWSDVYETIIVFPMAITVIRTLISPRGKTFKVTPKGIVDPHRINVNWPVIRPLLIIAALMMFGLIWRSSPLQETLVNPDSLAINMVWSSYNFLLILVCALVAIDVPQRRHPRFLRSEPCELIVGDNCYGGQTVDLSEEGARIRLNRLPAELLDDPRGELHFLAPSPLVYLRLPIQLRWSRMVALGKNATALEIGVQFLPFSLPKQRRFIRYLYCQPGQWDEVRVPEIKTAWAMIQSVLRLHPLAESR
ncbi:glycosyltransferase [Thermosynechococcus sp. B3]|uniref:glycosyltransferase n=1 Tax=unclassified Thermosynechococcus TaxID=2622553 RepID=UPI002575F0F6|nr:MULTISPECIES: glycosyltransferase [unclassified Thermosynechococcus]WJI25589.1 glycosyltransferase [Thermosynechococcus sp. B1]WJI28121.1 glycosyltransferase [Thermosynechococcus sp. B3]